MLAINRTETALDTATGKTVMRINSKFYRPSKVELLIFFRPVAYSYSAPIKLEVEREFCGDPSKIQACIGKKTFFDLIDTLKWMLKESL